MTEDKALVERLNETLGCYLACMEDVDKHASTIMAARDRIEALTAENERLREAGTKLAGFAGHDIDCEDATGAYPGSCSCGYSVAWKAWSAAFTSPQAPGQSTAGPTH